jgi:hypothetical protein
VVEQQEPVGRDRSRRLARWCFRSSLALAAGLSAAVLAAPWAARRWPDAVPRWLELLAGDQTVRRTMVFAAVGLWLTALIWFRGTKARGLQE